MTEPITCEGAPRDQGLRQGEALRRAICDWAVRVGCDRRRSFLSSIRPLAAGPILGTGVGREVLRHHPHIAERMDGIARGAGLPLSSLMELVIPGDNRAALSGAAACDLPVHVALVSKGRQRGLIRALPTHVAPGCDWVIRRSAPEIGFRSVELTLPWLASCVAGVNERGLAIAIVPEPGSAPSYSFAPPAILLVQDCLQRFADLEAALEWCAGRPAAPGVAIALSDASGDCATGILTPDGCRVLRTGLEQETIVCGGDEASATELRKRLDTGESALTALGADAGAVHLDPKARTLTWRRPGGDAPLVFRVGADQDGDAAGTPPETQ